MAYRIDKEKCVGCGVCAENCPMDLITEQDGKYVINEDECVSCGSCESNCPNEAIAEA